MQRIRKSFIEQHHLNLKIRVFLHDKERFTGVYSPLREITASIHPNQKTLSDQRGRQMVTLKSFLGIGIAFNCGN